MSDKTSIQWADSTVNPIMGCGGCELFPSPGEICYKINQAVQETGHSINSREIYSELVSMMHSCIEAPLAGHKNAVNTSNIWHLRERFLWELGKKTDDKKAVYAAEKAIKESVTCYAAILHLNKGQNLQKEKYEGHSGYAPIFESVTQFPGRAAKTAKLKDLLGCSEDRSVWKANLPRLIFVSDMGDAMSGLSHFSFLKNDLMEAITSDAGKRHLWLWLTKRPSRLADFAEEIGGFPENVCAMTTLTSGDEKNLKRLADLKKVKAKIRGLSIEPLWERIDPKKLDLKGIDWVIVGGESGSGDLTRPFALEWAEELRDYCRRKRVAFFCKQLGRKPTRNGEPVILKDSHGGDWDEWPDENLKVREFPKAFHNHRKTDMKHPQKNRTNVPKKLEIELLPPTKEEKLEYKRLHKIVEKGVKSFVDAGEALSKIHDGKLWRAGGFKNWEDYCRDVAGMSRVNAHRLMKASQCVMEMRAVTDISVFPNSESQVRPLLKFPDQARRNIAWDAAVMQATERQPTAAEVDGFVKHILVTGIEIESESGEIYPPLDQKHTSKSERRKQTLSKIREVIEQRKSWDDVAKLLDELEHLF